MNKLITVKSNQEHGHLDRVGLRALNKNNALIVVIAQYNYNN